MTDPARCHIAFIADRSGSMNMIPAGSTESRAEATTRGIRAMVTEQAALPGKTTFGLTQFDDRTDTIARFSEGSAILRWTCQPRGATALLDAAADTITRLGADLAGRPDSERPGRVIVVIATDGQENASRRTTLPQLADMIAHQRDAYQWEFLFLGAGLDAFGQAADLGVPAAASLSVGDAGFYDSYVATSSAVTRGRVSGQSVSYSDSERDLAEG